MSKSSIPQKVLQFIQQNKLIHYGDFVLLAVSGGLDSVALFHLFMELRHELGVQMAIVHIDHSLRDNSHKDADFVFQLATMHGIKCFTKKLPKRKSINQSIEEYAREQRLKFYKKMVKKTGANAVVLAHHQNDVAETILMRMFRGTGLYGLRSILPERLIDGVRLIRPCLGVSRSELKEYIDQKKQAYREDPTNLKNDFFRNLIRNELIPKLTKSYDAQIVDHMNRLAKVAAIDYDYIENEVDHLFEKIVIRKGRNLSISSLEFRNLHGALKSGMLRKMFQDVSNEPCSVSLTQIEQIINDSEGKIEKKIFELPNFLRCEVSTELIKIYRSSN